MAEEIEQIIATTGAALRRGLSIVVERRLSTVPKRGPSMTDVDRRGATTEDTKSCALFLVVRFGDVLKGLVM